MSRVAVGVWLCLGLGLGLAACSAFDSPQRRATIVVPPPATPQPEPSALQLQRPNLSHIHALAVKDGGRHIVIATHHGLEITGLEVGGRGVLPQPLAASALKGDVLEIFYTGPTTLLAGGHNLGVQRSVDDGQSWAPVAAEVTGLDVHGLAADPANPCRMYLYAVGKGVLVSSDCGGHWSHLPGYADNRYLTGLAVTADGTLLAGTPDLGVAASTDHGSSFVSVRRGTGQVYSLAASASSADVVIVGAENGIFLTRDGGKSWNVGETNVAVTGVAIDPADPQRFYAGGADGSLSVSSDAGATWHPL